jgi:hypothetical protein
MGGLTGLCIGVRHNRNKQKVSDKSAVLSEKPAHWTGKSPAFSIFSSRKLTTENFDRFSLPIFHRRGEIKSL